MPFRRALDVIDQIVDYRPYAGIVLSGGEPTLYRRFDRVLAHALERVTGTVIVNSNGMTGICEFFKRRRTFIKARVQFSIDGDACSHDEIRGQGSFHAAFNNLQELSMIGLRPWVSTVVTPGNIASMDRLRDLLVSVGVEKWHVSPILPFGRAANQRMLTVEAWNSFVDHLIDTTPLRLSIKKLFDFTLLKRLDAPARKDIERSVSMRSARNCGCGNEKLYVYPNLNVYGCACLMKYPFGNLRSLRLAEIMRSPNAALICNYNLSEDSPCRRCDYVHLCNGGCIGMSLSLFGRIGFGDPRCPLLKELAGGRLKDNTAKNVSHGFT